MKTWSIKNVIFPLAGTYLVKHINKKQRLLKIKYLEGCSMSEHRIYTMSFVRVYPLLVKKAEKKGRNKSEVDEIIG